MELKPLHPEIAGEMTMELKPLHPEIAGEMTMEAKQPVGGNARNSHFFAWRVVVA